MDLTPLNNTDLFFGSNTISIYFITTQGIHPLYEASCIFILDLKKWDSKCYRELGIAKIQILTLCIEGSQTSY